MADMSICIDIGAERLRANMTGGPGLPRIIIRSRDDYVGTIWSRDPSYLERLAAAINAAAEEPATATEPAP